ncbi:RING/FYVE/PHD zinc finger superfamily protein [Abeliophyllum distichum]|uniref:RING/FYVE/PHD zinc finger superfamily protein n=1 Tax=Abeliophyllum distichum TaxID=126358 RepID=A0ABD1RC42_9LAMI
MGSLEITRVDLECGRRSSAGVGADADEGSLCFSDTEDGSCYSQFYSTADGDASYDDYNFACGSGRGEIFVASGRSSSDCSSGDLETGENKMHLGKVERDCRICHLSLVSSSPETGVAIELGCSCKDDLAAAHRHCAETWFKIKGNKTCEICNSIARNVVGPNDIEAAQQTNGSNSITVNTASAPAPMTTETQSCINGHRFLNFLLACLVFAFVISWLFHFNIPS